MYKLQQSGTSTYSYYYGVWEKVTENKHTGGFRPKFGYDVDDNGYLVPCEKEQSVM